MAGLVRRAVVTRLPLTLALAAAPAAGRAVLAPPTAYAEAPAGGGPQGAQRAPDAAAGPSAQGAQAAAVTLEWLGWSHFRFTSPTGKVILTNPFVANPDSPVRVEDIERADLILVPNGHGDEVGQTVPIAQRTGARTLSPFELGSWLIEQGVPQQQVVRSNPGGRFRLDDVLVRVVGSVHGSGLPAPTATTPYGGPAAGFVVTFENGWTVYFAGSTAATQDQALWAQLYRPDAAIIVLGGGAEPMDFAMQVKLLTTDNPNLRTVLPHHHRAVQPPGQTTVAEAQAAVRELGLDLPILSPVIGQAYRFTK
jgi:L-ascorbate metabolism protein UlaG (beta-lactamase superfamily)